MKTDLKNIIIIIAALSVVPVAAQTGNSSAEEPDRIFSTMMQTMPPELKLRVDSASHAVTSSQICRDSSGSSKHSDLQHKKVTGTTETGIDNLPEAIRAQVLKTMQEIETDKQKRMLEFKEAKGSEK